MKQTLVLRGRFPSWNEIVDKSKTHWTGYSSDKGRYTGLVQLEAYRQGLRPMTGQIAVTCRWYCKDKRRDPDNIGSAVKYILDGLVSAKIIPNDGWRQIGRIVHEYEQSKDDGVIVTLEQITTTEKTEETQK